MKIATLFEESSVLTGEQKEWLVNHSSDYELHTGEFLMRNGKIDVISGSCYIEEFDQEFDNLPSSIRFGNVFLFYYKNCVLTNFDLLPSKAEKIFFLAETKVPPSLKGLSKVLKQCGKLTLNKFVKSGLLEVFKIKGIDSISYLPTKHETKTTSIEKAIKIVNIHLASGDVFQCQEELYDAGLGKFC